MLWIAANWSDAKRRVLSSYREWIRAVRFTNPRDTLDLAAPKLPLLVLSRRSRAMEMRERTAANSQTRPPKSKPCTTCPCPFPPSELVCDKNSSDNDLWTSFPLLTFFYSSPTPNTRCDHASQPRMSWYYKRGVFFADPATTGDHELLEADQPYYGLLQGGELPRWQATTKQLHDWLPRGERRITSPWLGS